MSAIYIGIDPGALGGMACLGHADGPASAVKMPDNDWGVLHWLRGHKGALGVQTYVVLEKVGGWIPKKVNGRDPTTRQPGSHMFNFGDSYGSCRMAVVACGVRPDLVAPQTWQAAFTVSRETTGGRTDRKALLKELAQRLFPQLKVTAYICDALLMALYCKAKVEGTLHLLKKRGRLV